MARHRVRFLGSAAKSRATELFLQKLPIEVGKIMAERERLDELQKLHTRIDYLFKSHEKLLAQLAFDTSNQRALEARLRDLQTSMRLAEEGIKKLSPALQEGTSNE